MPAHLWKRPNGFWYITDGQRKIALKTDIKRHAEARLAQYLDGTFGLTPNKLIGEYYEKWISEKEKLSRPSGLRDYKQHFSTYIMPVFAMKSFAEVRVTHLLEFRGSLLGRGLSWKTCRNIIDASFRSMWRSARAEELAERDPFELLDWPAKKQQRPDPFTLQELSAMLAWFKRNRPLYFALVMFQFETGARPSETFALRFRDIDWNKVSIFKSRNLGVESGTKTANSRRIITVGPTLASLLAAQRLPIFGATDYVFFNQFGGPLNNEWAKGVWQTAQDAVGIAPHKKFYATRHTFITEHVKANHNLKAIADYCGTSVQMIEQNYCSRLELQVAQPDVKLELGTIYGAEKREASRAHLIELALYCPVCKKKHCTCEKKADAAAP